ncbi:MULTISPECIES: urease accessory protein UreF [unclassified Fibrobacter]|uniref:urease accessory protein UreF n=1 Tax=unclassified Fibrobacter TaxID=2634177 RepID=UPI000D6D4EE9|nr:MULTISPECIES: urease accessory protein UreF [unclassified Fibrobacter]PWJ61386.1 urease accessory protein [Fibrobacter sp. UWR4]PZW65521.1 urease accessory protein [Fibrobacter sp. UWR1]
MLATLRMIQVCDSLFPIGAFTLSNGLETLIANKTITNGETLQEYVSSFLNVLPYNDLGVMMLSYDHAADFDYIQNLDSFSMALKAPEEVRTGSKKLCSRFLKIYGEFEGAKNNCFPSLDFYRDEVLKNGSCIGNHAIAIGLFANDIGLNKEEAASIYTYSLLNAIVTNGVKMIPLSQMVGQKILSNSQKKIIQAVQRACTLDMDDLGVGGTGIDIAGMKHEELYSRLYMS